MKKLFLSTALLALTAAAALAADLPSRKVEPLLPPPPPPPMWTGIYAGLNAGYNFGTNGNVQSQNWAMPAVNFVGVTYTSLAPLAMDGSRSNTQSGFIGGAQFGYNYQIGNFVLGIETDIQGSGTRGNSRTGGPTGINHVGNGYAFSGSAVGSTAVNSGVDYVGTVRGRIGYLLTPTMLVYGTGGFTYGGAYAQVTQTANSNGTTVTGGRRFGIASAWVGAGQQNQLLTGWNAGGGLEWMFMPNWSLKGEALYWDLGRMNVQTASFNRASLTPESGYGRTSVSYQGIQAKLGINYHFNWGAAAPIVAKY